MEEKMQEINYPIIVAISGASGTVYGIRLLQFLLQNNYKVELVISDSALKVAKEEISLNLSKNSKILKEQVLSHLDSPPKYNDQLNVWASDDIAASISSGSYRTSGMIIIPASMGTIGSIASGTSDNLITRAADVCIKEKRKLILVPRETPYSTIHLENLLKLSKTGAIIAPASPGYYHNPQSIDEMINFVVGKVLDVFGVDHNLFKRWEKSLQLNDYKPLEAEVSFEDRNRN